MNFVFEKALLSLLFYTQNHSFIAHDLFLQNIYPYTLSLLFMEGQSEPITCSSVLVLFLENVLLSRLFTLNRDLRDINTDFFPRSLHSIGS